MKATAAIVLALLSCVLVSNAADITEDGLIVEFAKNTAKLSRVTSKPFKMDAAAAFLCAPAPRAKTPNEPHREYYCHVYIDEPGLKIMKTGDGLYPVGTVIVKQKFSDATAKSAELYTLMRKREQGYDPEHGDWEYSIVNRQATQVLARGRIESCIECHKAHEKTDYVTRQYMRQNITDPASPADAPK